MKTSVLVLIFNSLWILSGSLTQAQNQLPQLGKSPVEQVVKAMTLDEKAHFVVGNGFYLPGLKLPDLVAEPRLEQKILPGTAGTTLAIPRLGIPSIRLSDGPSGLDVYYLGNGWARYATAWPTPTLLASSWDTDLAERVGAAFGNEIKEYGVDIMLAPGLNIHRNPLGGRNYEYYSEDPVVTGHLAAAMIRGIQQNGVGTSAKHLVANDQETNRQTLNTIVGERALREIYLKPFEIALKTSEPWTVMSSYNLLNGTYTSERRDLITDILRNEWRFGGMVMTDWFGGIDPVAQTKAGNDLIMPGLPKHAEAILAAVKGGTLDAKLLDENVTRILTLIQRTPSFGNYAYSNKPDLFAHAQLSRQAAAEGMVLLKNDGQTLPIRSNQHLISLFGNSGYDLIIGGSGGGMVNVPYKISLNEGLARAGYTLEQSIEKQYDTYVKGENLKRPKLYFLEQFARAKSPTAELVVADEAIKKSAQAADIGLISIGRSAGEGNDRKPEDYYLNETEKDLIRRVADAFHAQNKKVVVVLNIGGVTDVIQWRDNVDAIVLAWQPGHEGGNALADVLSGRVNPSGRLVDTLPTSYSVVPSAKNFPGKTLPDQTTPGPMGQKLMGGEVTYEEGIYVGYRYYNTFGVKLAYEFGYGLPYTDFGYDKFKLSRPTFRDKLTATVAVTNTGHVAGREVVQLYLTAPAGRLDKPAVELKGFVKTGLLQPGQSQTLTFTVTAADLASFDPVASAWVAEAGTYTVRVGGTSMMGKQTATFTLDKEMVVEKTHKALSPQVPLREMSSKR